MKQTQNKKADLLEELSILTTRRDNLQSEIADLENKLGRTERQISKVEDRLKEQKENKADSQEWIMVKNPEKDQEIIAQSFEEKAKSLKQFEQKELKKVDDTLQEVKSTVKTGLLRGGREYLQGENPTNTILSTLLNVLGICAGNNRSAPPPEITENHQKDRGCDF
jgi:hypothetical protein